MPEKGHLTMTKDLPEVGPWAREKLDRLRAYLSAYMKILSHQASLRTVYVDAFAASGRAVVRKKEHDDPTIHLELGDEARDQDSRQVIDGSPRVALGIEPPFEQYVFIESDERRLAELKALEMLYGTRRKIAVRSGDCNTYLTTTLLNVLASNRRWRGVVFLDPFGMQVPWSTIKRLADTKQIEVFINFPVGMAIQRLLPRSAQLTPRHRAKLDAYFGDPSWYDEVYLAEAGLFEAGMRKRPDAGERLLKWYRERLKRAFGHVSTARLITNSKGGHLYYLVFAGPNATGAKIANHVLGPARAKRG
jgi:three-Cys-motif partner protein